MCQQAATVTDDPLGKKIPLSVRSQDGPGYNFHAFAVSGKVIVIRTGNQRPKP